MQTVPLPQAERVTTRLGYGCGGLMRLPTARARANVLAAAYDAGIRHFDVARMYGLGQAEQELGRFLQGRRDRVTVATKFGIEVSERVGRLAALQGIARQLMRVVPGLRRFLRRRSGSLYVPKDFSVAAARRSLEASLRALRTDHVDLFLLHEPLLAEVEETGILEYLEQARASGLIRGWGLAGYPEQLGPLATAMPRLAPVLQLPNDMLGRQLDAFRHYNAAFITFSPLSGSRTRVAGLLRSVATTRRDWSAQLGLDLSARGVADALLLSWCLVSNPQGIVLFSSTNQAHIQAAANLVDDAEMHEKSAIFDRLVHAALEARPSGG